MGIQNFGTFLLAGVLLNITPGADTFYILGRTLSNGKKAGIISALAISTGSLIHTLFAAIGLSVLLTESQVAFQVVKYMGAGYLIFLGIKTIISKHNSISIYTTHSVGLHKIFYSGVITNVLNPKVALFYLAFLPQFIDPNYSNHLISFLLLGISFTCTSTLWCLALAFFASRLSQKLKENQSMKKILDKIGSIVFIGLGIKLAIGEK